MLTSGKITFNITNDATALGQFAANLDPGESAEYSAGRIPFPLHIMTYAHWSMKFFYDPLRKEFQCIGKCANTGGGNGLAGHVVFSEVDDEWRLIQNMYEGLIGHIYCSNAMDPDGNLYYVRWGNQFAEYYTRATDLWDGQTATDSTAWGTAPHAITEWHPNLFSAGVGGLVNLARQLPARVRFWRRATNAWSGLDVSSHLTVNMRNGGGIYSPAMNAVVCGCGVDGNNTAVLKMIKVMPGPTWAPIADAPLRVGDHFSAHPITVHPTRGLPMILEQNGSDRVWVHEPDAGLGEWVQQSYTHPFSQISAGGNVNVFIACPVPPYGVVAGLKASFDRTTRMDLWRPPS